MKKIKKTKNSINQLHVYFDIFTKYLPNYKNLIKLYLLISINFFKLIFLL